MSVQRSHLHKQFARFRYHRDAPHVPILCACLRISPNDNLVTIEKQVTPFKSGSFAFAKPGKSQALHKLGTSAGKATASGRNAMNQSGKFATRRKRKLLWPDAHALKASSRIAIKNARVNDDLKHVTQSGKRVVETRRRSFLCESRRPFGAFGSFDFPRLIFREPGPASKKRSKNLIPIVQGAFFDRRIVFQALCVNRQRFTERHFHVACLLLARGTALISDL